MSIPPRARRTPGPTEQNEADNLIPTTTRLTVPGRFQQFSGARVRSTSNQSYTTGQTQSLVFNTKVFDTNNYWDGSSKFYVPEPGFYYVNYNVAWADVSTNNYRLLTIIQYDTTAAAERNVAQDLNWAWSSSGPIKQNLTAIVYAEPPGYFYAKATNGATTTQTLQALNEDSPNGCIALIGLSPGSFLNQLSGV